MLKILGLLLIVGASGMTGLFLSYNFSKRVTAIETAILLVEKMQTYLRYGQVPTGELVARLAEQEAFRSFSFLKECHIKLEQGVSFPVAWGESVAAWKGSALSEEDKRALSGIADILGGSDYVSQLSALELTEAMLKQNLTEALEEKNTRGKLCRSLGLLLGIGAAIFFA